MIHKRLLWHKNQLTRKMKLQGRKNLLDWLDGWTRHHRRKNGLGITHGSRPVIFLDTNQDLGSTLKLRHDGGTSWMYFWISVGHALVVKTELNYMQVQSISETRLKKLLLICTTKTKKRTLSNVFRTRVAKVMTLLMEILGKFLRASPDLINDPQHCRTFWDLQKR